MIDELHAKVGALDDSLREPSFNNKQRVTTLILEGAGPSLALALPAFAFASILAIALGLFCAYYRGSPADVITRTGGVGVIGPVPYCEGVSVETGELAGLPDALAALDGVEELLASWLGGEGEQE